MLLNSLSYHHGSTFTGEYRIRSPRSLLSHNGTPYIALELGDMTGALKGYLWLDCRQQPPLLADQDCVTVHAQLRYFNHRWMANIKGIEVITSPSSHPAALIPVWDCPRGYLLPQLHHLVTTVESVPLRTFLARLVADNEISSPFVAAPASVAYHHAYAGGLLEHSLECAEIVRQIPLFSAIDREIGTIAALLHDIGKVRTLTMAGTLSHSGFLLDHDALTLEILGSHLRYLDDEWPDAAIALRYLLTWKIRRDRPFPLMTIAEAVNAADRISSGHDRETKAFTALPQWRNTSDSFTRNGFWRPMPHRVKVTAADQQQALAS